MSQVLVAKESFATELANGQPVVVQEGMTRVDANSELPQRFPHLFKELDANATFGIEDATADPGRSRNRQDRGSAEAGETRNQAKGA